jgi:hypothetical protein
MKIEIQERPPNLMCLDLGVKFSRDLTALLVRTVSIMRPAIGTEDTTNVIMSVLANCGLKLEEVSNSAHGSFAAIVETAQQYRTKED